MVAEKIRFQLISPELELKIRGIGDRIFSNSTPAKSTKNRPQKRKWVRWFLTRNIFEYRPRLKIHLKNQPEPKSVDS